MKETIYDLGTDPVIRCEVAQEIIAAEIGRLMQNEREEKNKKTPSTALLKYYHDAVMSLMVFEQNLSWKDEEAVNAILDKNIFHSHAKAA
jgi:hypothetical protein